MGETVRMGDRPTSVPLPNSEQFFLDSDQGQKYLIQISWPLHWVDNRTSDRGAIPIIYIVDGNALFLTATEVAWRRAASSHFSGGGLIVAIGYPVAGKLYDAKRRSLDLTPPTESPIAGAGGADAFLDFIEKSVRPAVKVRFPRATISREALYGHSYGGLFSLHALFTRSHVFDCYIASSPSIWWNSRYILHSAQRLLDKEEGSDGKSPSLLISWGSWEQNPPQWNDEPLDHYEGRKQIAAELRMADNALELVKMLGGCRHLHTVQAKEYEGEEHTSVMACSVSRGITMFFEDWPPTSVVIEESRKG